MFFTVVFIIYGAIVIRYGRCKIKELVIWHPKNTAVELSGFVISGGMIYTTSELTESAHIISTRFPVACHDPLFTLSKKSGQQITYSTMNKYQRRLYLKWLAGNRSDAKIGIEYVFLFFYGLEWRFFEIDNNMDFLLEKEDIIQELQRLAAVYDHDDSFRKQVKKLLSFNALCSYGGIGISKEEFEKYNYPPTTDLNDIPSTIENDTLSQVRELFTVEDETPIDLKILLGSAIGSHMPIPAILALLWVKTSKDYRIYFGATVRRYEDKFNKLFVQRYYAKYGAGIVVDKKPGTELYLRYELATPGGRCFIKRVGTAVDIRYYSYCLVILQEIVNEATNLLEISYATIWHPMGSAVDIQNIRIPGGMIYTKSKNSNLRCVIATNLPISDYSSKIKPSKLSYWPSYSTGTSKEQRRAYLTWLANGRCEPVDDIGYVFLFFYGLEQRYFEILVNDSPEKEMEQIKNEVRRLLEIYGQDSSFRMYANQFLNYMEANVVPNEDIDLSKFEKYTYFNRETHETPIDLKITLGNLIYRGKPIPVTMALAWLKNPGGYAATFRTPARRCEKEFNELFIQKYQEKYGDGIILKLKPATELKLNYRSASANIEVSETTVPNTVDIEYYRSFLNKLQKIVNDVTDALDSYSRVLARNLMATEETYLYLPEQMRNQKFTSPLEKLRQENKRYFLSEIIQILKISKPSRKTLSLLLEFLNSNAITYTDDIGAHDIRGNSSKTLASKNSFANSNKITKMTQLDQKKIKNLEEETRLIQDTLAQEIFVEDFPKISENVPGSKPKLSAKSNELFNHIIQREEWTMEELGEFAKNRQIMLDGALEEINDNFTETFIEIFGDMVYVNLNLIKETNN